MPEHCPHCGEQVISERVDPDDGRPFERWRCPDCEAAWRHPEETVLDRTVDFSERGNQLSRRESDTELEW